MDIVLSVTSRSGYRLLEVPNKRKKKKWTSKAYRLHDKFLFLLKYMPEEESILDITNFFCFSGFFQDRKNTRPRHVIKFL